jgi:hypothetical protein
LTAHYRFSTITPRIRRFSLDAIFSAFDAFTGLLVLPFGARLSLKKPFEYLLTISILFRVQSKKERPLRGRPSF